MPRITLWGREVCETTESGQPKASATDTRVGRFKAERLHRRPMAGGRRHLALLFCGCVLVLSSSSLALGHPLSVPAAHVEARMGGVEASVRATSVGVGHAPASWVLTPPPSRRTPRLGSATSHESLLLAADAAPTPSTAVGTAFPGLDSGCGFCAAAPPDVQIATGPTYLLEMVNLGGEIATKGGTQLAVFSLRTFPFGFPLTDRLSDPQVLYDNASQRYFATLTDVTTGEIQLAVSRSSNPALGWWDYNITSVPAGDIADQPMLGVSDNLVGVGANIFSSSGGAFYGGEFWVVAKAKLLTGSVANYATWGPSCGVVCSYEPSINPVRSLSSTAVQYFLSSGTGSTSTVTLYTVAGVPPATPTVTTTDIPVIPLTQPPTAPQLGSTHTLDTADGRVLDAVWQGGQLWAAMDDACVPTGDTSTRSCFRLLEVDTATSLVVVDHDWGTAGAYDFYPAVSLDASGDLTLIVGYASPTEYPGLYVWGQGYNAPGTLQPGVNLTGSLPSGAATDPSCTSVCRYGDYFGAAKDPNSSVIWVAGEYGRSGTYWATYIGAVQTVSGFGVTAAASRASVDLGQSVTFTAAASQGTPPYSYAWTGLPPGCTAANAPTVDCVPTAAGSYSVVASANDSTGSSTTSAPVAFQVFPDPYVAPPVLSRSGADTGQVVIASVFATGGTGVFTYTWSLPPGCSGTGTPIVCVPSSPGAYNVSVSVVDSNGGTAASAPSPLLVSPALGITLTARPSPALLGHTVAFAGTVSGGLPNYTYTWSGLPTGCVGPGDRGNLTCIPATPATYAVNVTVVDGNGMSASAKVSLIVETGALGVPISVWASALAAVAVVAVVIVALLLARRQRQGPPPPVAASAQPPGVAALGPPPTVPPTVPPPPPTGPPPGR